MKRIDILLLLIVLAFSPVSAKNKALSLDDDGNYAGVVDSELEKKEGVKSNKNSKHLLGALFDGSKQSGDKTSYMPQTAFEYAKMCEPELGIPPKIILDDCIEIPL